MGNGLKLHHAILDQIDSDFTGSLQEKVEAMLKRWLMTQDERGTVSRLTKALYNHREWDAIAVIRP